MCSSTRCIRAEYSAWLAFLVKAYDSGNSGSDHFGNGMADATAADLLCRLREWQRFGDQIRQPERVVLQRPLLRFGRDRVKTTF
jgi:hypothetical protein